MNEPKIPYKNEVWAIIPARGGSKGVPKKNIRDLGGQPLLAYAIKAAAATSDISKIFVSTDDNEIASVAINYGAEVISRPTDLAGDTSASESAILHALDFLFQKLNYLPEYLVFMQCTSPFTTQQDLTEAINKVRSNADSVFTATEFYHFIWENKESGAEGINHNKKIRLRRQDLKPQYQETGAAYVLKTPQFLKYKHRFFGRTEIQVVPQDRSLDIDTFMDFSIAEIILKASNRS